MIIKRSLSDTTRGITPNKGKAKDFLDAIGERFKESDKAETESLMSSFVNTKYDHLGGIRSFILRKIQALLG